MIHIKYEVKESPIHGIGLFTKQKINKGETIWTPNDLLDVNLKEKDFLVLDEKDQNAIRYYGFFNRQTNDTVLLIGLEY